jgi:hypothetical protein
MSNRIGDFLVYGMVVAGILVLTKQGSQGPAIVTNIGGAFAGVIRAASGQKAAGGY